MRSWVYKFKTTPRWIRCLFLTAALLSAPVAVSAADIRISASVDNTEVTLEDVLNLKVVVEGTQQAPEPQPPALPDFKVRSGGRSSSLQVINGQRTASTTFNYQLIPTQPGNFTIAPFTLKIDSNPYITAPIQITVRKQESSARSDSVVFAEVSVPTHQPYVNELLPLTLKVYRKVDVRNVNVELPLDAFRKQELGPPKQYHRVLKGVRYDVYEWNMALYPLRPGKATVPPARIELDVVEQKPSERKRPLDPFFNDPFFQSPFFQNQYQLKHKILRTEPIELDVLPLPESNRPDPFSNLVGQFKINATLSRTQLDQGDTLTLTVTVEGEGNPQDAVLHLPDAGEQFKVYPDQPQFTRSGGDDTIAGKKVFKYALVPLASGSLTFPAIRLAYFDPRAHTYRIIHSEPLSLTVTPVENAASLQTVEPQTSTPEVRPSLQSPVEDINPIHTRREDFSDQSTGSGFWISVALGLLLPPAAFLIFARLHRQRQRLRFDTAYNRRVTAFTQAEQRLNRLATQRNGDDRETVRELSQIVRAYIGDRLNLQGTAFTPGEVEEQLRNRNFKEEQITATRQLLDKYEILQYAAGQHSDPEALLAESRRLLEKLEAA